MNWINQPFNYIGLLLKLHKLNSTKKVPWNNGELFKVEWAYGVGVCGTICCGWWLYNRDPVAVNPLLAVNPLVAVNPLLAGNPLSFTDEVNLNPFPDPYVGADWSSGLRIGPLLVFNPRLEAISERENAELAKCYEITIYKNTNATVLGSTIVHLTNALSMVKIQ